MKTLNFTVFVFIVTMLSCNSNAVNTYNFGKGIEAVWDKESGHMIFSNESGPISMVKEFRKSIDTIEIEKNGSIALDRTGKYSFQMLENDQLIGTKVTLTRQIHDGINAICTHTSANAPYNKKGKLNDGIAGTEDYTSGEWVGWKNKDAIIEFDFEGDQSINYISYRYRDDIENNIFPPKNMGLEVSVDGQNWEHLITRNVVAPGYPISGDNFTIRGTYKKIRLTVGNYTTGDNIESWLLIDEVTVAAR